jgi:hypothetical protein
LSKPPALNSPIFSAAAVKRSNPNLFTGCDLRRALTSICPLQIRKFIARPLGLPNHAEQALTGENSPLPLAGTKPGPGIRFGSGNARQFMHTAKKVPDRVLHRNTFRCKALRHNSARFPYASYSPMHILASQRSFPISRTFPFSELSKSDLRDSPASWTCRAAAEQAATV